jgi:hypothetical protein
LAHKVQLVLLALSVQKAQWEIDSSALLEEKVRKVRMAV